MLILCNNETNIADYIEKWTAQMLQYPEVKTICPVLISNQGAGKGSLIKTYTKLIGESKFFQSSTPSRDVWGGFNSLMTDAFLVNLDEMARKETNESMGKIKTLITEPTLTINTKGIPQFEIVSYHRLFCTTNNTDPMPTDSDDRRTLIIKSSNELIGNADYFNKLNKYLEDENVLRTLFDYFMSIPDMKNFGKIKKPITEYQKNLQTSNVNIVELWVQDLVRTNYNQATVKLLGNDMFKLFITWRNENGIKYDVNTVKLVMNVQNLVCGGGIYKGEHTVRGNHTVFDINVLKNHYHIGNLIDDSYNAFEEQFDEEIVIE